MWSYNSTRAMTAFTTDSSASSSTASALRMTNVSTQSGTGSQTHGSTTGTISNNFTSSFSASYFGGDFSYTAATQGVTFGTSESDLGLGPVFTSFVSAGSTTFWRRTVNSASSAQYAAGSTIPAGFSLFGGETNMSNTASSLNFVSSFSSAGTGTVTNFSSTFKITGFAAPNPQPTATYNFTTTTSTTAITFQTTTTSTRSSIFPTSAAGGRTTSSSSADTYTNSTTTNVTQTLTTYSTSSYSGPVLIDTIIEAATSDWIWLVTTTGTGQLSALGNSFTKSTFTDQGFTTSAPFFYYASSVSSSTASAVISFTQPAFSSKTTTSSVMTSTQSTYSIGAPSAMPAAAPFTSTKTTALNYTTSVSTSYSFSTTSAQSVTSTFRSVPASFTGNPSQTSSFTVTSTYGGGTTTVSLTWLTPPTTFGTGIGGKRYTYTTAAVTSITSATQSTSGSIGTTSVSGSTITGITQAFEGNGTTNLITLIVSRSNAAITSASAPTFLEVSIGAGFQAFPSVGRTEPYGTNFNFSTSVTQLDTVWPSSVRAALVSPTAVAGTVVGVLPQTLTNSQQTSRIGGWGWNSAASTVGSNAAGIHSLTTCNSTTTGTATTQWNSTASTYAVGPGDGVAAESVPQVSSRLSSSFSPALSFSAFPST